jgi:cation diffusion facilitator family transporter
MSAKGDSLKPILYALGANFAIFVAKLIAAIITGSGSMMAESVHSLADCGNQVLLLFGMRHSRRGPSADHPLGYGMAVYFWSFLVALLLFAVGGVFSVYEGLHKLHAPEALNMPWLAIGVLVFAIVAESFSMWGCLREVNKARGRKSLWRWLRHSRQSELIVIFGEDLAALLGLVLALVAVVATYLTGNPLFDAMGSIAIGVLLCVVAVFVARVVASLLMGKSAEPEMHDKLVAFVAARPEVKKVLNLITLQMGPDVMVAVKAEMKRGLSGVEVSAAINAVEAAMKAQFPEVRWSFFEPDVTD